jgi:putative PIN family toxin of toxin-antitoxin system
MLTASFTPTAPSNKLRVVLDTNVYFSALTHVQGQPFRIWQQAIIGQYTLLTSPAIMRELAHVLRDRADWQEPEIVAQLKLLARVAEIVVPKIIVRAISDDESDNRILECAAAGKADLVVSGDYHLRRLKSFEGIGIVRPVDFSRTLLP